jgi:hypothetical protein
MLIHGNTPIQKGETRYSITQYIPGALFRTVEYDFHTQEVLKKDHPDMWKSVEASEEARLAEGIDGFSLVDDLVKDREEVGKFLASTQLE